MSRLDYSKFSQKQRPTSAAIPNLALTAGPSGASASDEQTDSATLDTGHSKIWDFVAKLSGTELEDRQGISTEEKKTHKCLICSVTLAQHHIRFAISLWCVVKKRPFFIALDAELLRGRLGRSLRSTASRDLLENRERHRRAAKGELCRDDPASEGRGRGR